LGGAFCVAATKMRRQYHQVGPEKVGLFYVKKTEIAGMPSKSKEKRRKLQDEVEKLAKKRLKSKKRT